MSQPTVEIAGPNTLLEVEVPGVRGPEGPLGPTGPAGPTGPVGEPDAPDFTLIFENGLI